MNKHPPSNVIICKGDIAAAKADIIVNASNGSGYMGGKRSVTERRKGIAESLNYCTQGAIEAEAKVNARKLPFIPACILGHRAGTVFYTGSHGLSCRKVLHGVTMRYPGSFSRLKTIERLLIRIFYECELYEYRSIAIPLLGTGTGALDRLTVYHLTVYHAKLHPDILVYIYAGTEGEIFHEKVED